MAQKPEVRIKGFADDWEQCKLKDLCSVFTDGDWIEAKDQSNEGVRLVQTGNVGVTQYLDKTNNAKWISEETFSRLKCKEVFEGDILISRLPAPAGRACIMPDLGTKMITAVDCTIVRTLPEVNNDYLVQYLSTERYFKEINVCLAGGTRQRISRGNLAEFNIPLPNSSEEQRSIGNYFKALDKLIALYQYKLDKLLLTKKAMLRKMFPQNGAVVPEIRFKEFSVDWTEYKFGELYQKVSEKNDLSYGTDKIISVANMYFRGDVRVSDADYLKTYNVFKVGDIAFEGNKSKSFSHGRFVENTIGDGIVSHVFEVFRPKMLEYDLQFWKIAINSEELMGRALMRSTKSSTMMTTLVAEDFYEETILVPEVEEQKKIGAFFASLDNLISLQETKIEKLKTTKKALLKKMFV